jgi:hypothetical protein
MVVVVENRRVECGIFKRQQEHQSGKDRDARTVGITENMLTTAGMPAKKRSQQQERQKRCKHQVAEGMSTAVGSAATAETQTTACFPWTSKK